MAFDIALPTGTPALVATPEPPLASASTSCMAAPFCALEGIPLAIGGLSLGATIGALAFLTAGRVDASLAFSIAFAVYLSAIVLAALSCREIFATRALVPIGLFLLHLAALLAWPLLLIYLEPYAWTTWLGLPLALAASTAFFLAARAPARAMYRMGGHVCLIAAIGAYQWLWTAMGLPLT